MAQSMRRGRDDGHTAGAISGRGGARRERRGRSAIRRRERQSVGAGSTLTLAIGRFVTGDFAVIALVNEAPYSVGCARDGWDEERAMARVGGAR